MINVAPSMRFFTHLYIHDDNEVKGWILLLSFRNHLRLAVPPREEDLRAMKNTPASISSFRGRSALLSDDQGRDTISVRALLRCPMSQETMIRLPTGAHGAMAGKSSIRESHQIREFPIQEPWTQAAAESIGPGAADEWLQENNSPPLGEPPVITEHSKTILDELVCSVPGKMPPSLKDNGALLRTMVTN